MFVQTKDEFMGMFYVEITPNIPMESAEQPLLVRDYPLLKTKVRLTGILD